MMQEWQRETTRLHYMQHLVKAMRDWNEFNWTGNWHMEVIISMSNPPLLPPHLRGMFFSIDFATQFDIDKGEEGQNESMQGVPHLVTLVIVVRRHACVALDDVDSTVDVPIILEDVLIIFADGFLIKAGWTMVQVCLDRMMKKYAEHYPGRWNAASDGCASQFKSRKPFMGFRVLQERWNMEMVWTFAGTGRFKWKHDAHGGVVKALLRSYLKRQQHEAMQQVTGKPNENLSI